MKKYAMQSQFKTLLLLITMLWSSILFCATETVDGIVWRYTISNGEASVGGGKYNETAVPQSATGTIVIPATLGGKSVTSLAKCAFYQCSNITNVVIPSTVKSIGSSAFYNSGLSSIDIPDNVRTIDNYAFENCSNLENAKLPSDLKIIESRIFGGCSRLKSVNIPNGVECIKLGAFGACGFGNITIPGTVKSIHQEAFQNCTNMTSLTISEGVKSIGASAFRNCSKLAVVRLPNGVVNIGDFAFENCSSLVSVTIPDSVVNLGKYVFRYCNGQLFEEPISGIKLVDGWVVQRTGTHSDHISLYGIRGICAEAFSGCSALYSVSFSSDIAGIGENAFYGCKNLFCDTDTICGVKLMNGWVVGTTDELSGDIDLTGVKGIVGGAFNGCATITSVKIPDGVRCIAGRTFQGCSSLTNIVIPASVTCIADSWTFASCKNLRNIILPRNLCYLGNYSFAYCNNLNSIYVLGDEPATGHWFLFYYDEPGAMVYVTDAWNGPTDMWYYSKLPIALPTYTITYDPGLYGSGSQQTVTKNKNIALTLKDEIFARTGYIQTGWTTSDGGMKEYDLGAQYTANADAVLYPFWTANKYTVTFDANGGDGGWSSLLDYGVEIVAPTVTRSGCEFTGWFTAAEDGNEVTVPAVVTGDITLYAHWMANSGGDYGTPIFTVENDVLTTVDLNGATEVTIPDGVTSIGRGAFYGCSSLTSVTIPNSVTNIGVTAFWGCSTLTNVTIPDSVAIIGDSAFMSCNRLTIVNLPATLREQDEHLRMDVFVDCAPDLELIYYGDSEEVWTFTVDAQQRYPWNGKVDITYTLSGDVEAEIVMVSATDRETDETYTASSVTGDLGATAGTHRIVWDMGADGLTFKSTNVVFTVSFAVAVSDAHVRVRLWDDGPYWATTNIGAEEPWEYGYYFWWGDTVGYRYENDIWVATDGTSRGFSFGSGNVPTYGKDDSALYAEGWVTADGILALEHDAAQMQWGGDWRMPTADELAALNSNCDWMWTVTNGVNGYVVRGRGDYANNSIFLPAAGCGNWGSLSGAGSYGGDWSSVPSSGYSYNSWLLDFSSGGRGMDPNSRYHGRTVRPVQGANVATPAVTGTSGAKVIDLMHGRRTAAAVEQIRYSTDWGNGASVNATNAVAVVEVDGVVLSAASGSGFAEWVPSSDGIYTLTHKVLSGGLQIGETFSSEFLVTGFTPCWTVTFDLDGHGMRTGGGELVQSVTNGCIAVVPTVTANEGWTFTGWSGDVTAAIVGNTTFTAQWEEEEASPYTWSYLDNGDGTITITDVTPSPVGDLTIPSTIAGKSVTGIGDSVFRGCNGYYDHDSLTGITIPDGVQSIGADAFSYCYHLTRVTVPDSVTNIGSRAFLCCTQLRDLIISDSNLWYKSVDGLLLSKDGKNLLRGVDWSVPIPDSVTNIESYAFFCCDIASITIPDGVMRIGEHAFANCSGLTSMTIPDSVTSVEGWAFANCSGLVSVTIGSGVVDIGDGVFGGCTALTSFVVTEGNPTYKSESGLLVTADGSLLVAVPYNLTNVTIPEGVTSIGDGAFRDNSGLVSVTIPAGVTNIENSAFSGCSGLTSVTLPGGMTRIEDYTFMGCSSLVSITIPDSVTLIRSYAFSGCTGLTNVTIGSGVMSIGAGAFANCSRLASMTFYGNMPNVFHLNNYAYMDSFYAVSGACVAYVKRTASGFPEEGESWNGLTIAYLPDDTPDPSQDEVTFTAPEPWEANGMQVVTLGTTFTAPVVTNEFTVTGTSGFEFAWDILATNWWFMAAETENGSIIAPAADWMADGTNFVLSAIPTEHYHFVRWTGDTEGCAETSGTLEVTMDRPRTVGAEFEINSHRVSISETLCDTIPFIGEIDLVYGSIVTVEVVNAVIHCGAARYVCKGWMAANSDPESGEGARAELRVLGDVLLNWLWETNVVTLAQSVNAEDLDWTAGGASDWQPEWSDVASDGIHQARCGTIPNGTNAWLAAMVEGPGTLTFKWRSALVSRNTKYQFMVDGEVKGGLTGTNGWTEASVSVFGDRTHEIKWRLVTGRSGAAGGDWVALDEVVWTPTVPPTLAEALNTNFVWTTDGDVVWRGVTRESLTDARDAWAVVSGLGDDGTAAVQTRVYGSGVLSFDWSISCEEDYDWMELTVDGEVRDYVSGSVGWTQTAVEIVGDGWHTVRWEYVKDEMDDAEMVGDNIAKLDNVVWISDDTPPAVTETQTTPIPVPYAELEGKFSAYLEQAKGDYEVAAKMTGRNGYAIWESYVAGLEPENEHSKFTAKIEFRTVDGRQEPVVTWDPDRPELRATRIYTTYGKKTLLDHDWTPITDANKNEYNFFKVEVKMK